MDENQFWTGFIKWAALVVIVMIIAIAAYNIAYIEHVKPLTVPQYTWPDSGR